jgi:hypothetical protein
MAFIVLMAGPIKPNLENDPDYLKYAYPDSPETFSNGKLTGRLYKRSRTGKIGNWDGVWLNVTRPETQLSATAASYGPIEKSPEIFKRTQSFFDNIEWDDGRLDSEIAFGARLNIQGMLPIKKIIGALFYSKTGQPGADAPSIMLNAVPLPRALSDTEFTEQCTNTLNRMFRERAHQGPYSNSRNDVSVCDGWGSDLNGNTMYVALANLPTGDAINAIGYIPETMTSLKTTHLRDALLDIKLLR